ncbi:MAG: hypothetical protein PUP91_06885 [Rhizonema sp. PD37]|nr:hypothetical protein [Rhizonema sp. PD37]
MPAVTHVRRVALAKSRMGHIRCQACRVGTATLLGATIIEQVLTLKQESLSMNEQGAFKIEL